MADALDDLGGHELASEQVQAPTFAILGWGRTGQGHQMRFGAAVEPPLLAPFLLGVVKRAFQNPAQRNAVAPATRSVRWRRRVRRSAGR